VKEWLQERVSSAQDLFYVGEDYVLGRGVPEPLALRLGMGVWSDIPPPTPHPDPLFRERHGSYGEKLEGMLVTPLYSPRGELIGAECRGMEQKQLVRLLLPEAKWNPVFLGLDFEAATQIHTGGDVWVCEGLFDLGALSHVVPQEDTVLASMWARLSKKHVTFLRRFLRGSVYVVYDEDPTGRKGVLGWVDEKTKRTYWGALRSLRAAGITCQDVRYRGGGDPGEIWEKTGSEGLRQALATYL